MLSNKKLKTKHTMILKGCGVLCFLAKGKNRNKTKNQEKSYYLELLIMVSSHSRMTFILLLDPCVFFFRALYLNLLGLWIILVCAVFSGLTMYAYFKDCDPWTFGIVSAPDQVWVTLCQGLSFLSFLFGDTTTL